jgi:hypothetical protein
MRIPPMDSFSTINDNIPMVVPPRVSNFFLHHKVRRLLGVSSKRCQSTCAYVESTRSTYVQHM